jgi:tRNA A37 threonylcarbamoyladenosine biosynthesis protein TsaE
MSRIERREIEPARLPRTRASVKQGCERPRSRRGRSARSFNRFHKFHVTAASCCAEARALLSGGLGMGKTCFARGVGQQWMCDDQVSWPSPSYLIAIEYLSPDGMIIIHIDPYRKKMKPTLKKLYVASELLGMWLSSLLWSAMGFRAIGCSFCPFRNRLIRILTRSM